MSEIMDGRAGDACFAAEQVEAVEGVFRVEGLAVVAMEDEAALEALDG